MAAKSVDNVVARGDKGKWQNVYEVGLSELCNIWTDRPIFALWFTVILRCLVATGMVLVVPTSILDFAFPYFIFVSFQWVLLMIFFATGLDNIVLMLGVGIWFLIPFFEFSMIGDRATKPTGWARLPEIIISFVVFLYVMSTLKRIVLLGVRLQFYLRTSFICCGASEERRQAALHKMRVSIRFNYFFFFDYQFRVLRASLVLLINFVVSTILVIIDVNLCGIRLHTLWLLNTRVARDQTLGARQKVGASMIGSFPTSFRRRSTRAPARDGGAAPSANGTPGPSGTELSSRLFTGDAPRLSSRLLEPNTATV